MEQIKPSISLAQIVKDTIFAYAGGGLDFETYGLVNDEKQIYAVNAVDFPIHKRRPTVVVMVRIAGDIVVVEEDRTDRSVVEALVRNGIPREQVIRVHEGEALPDAQPQPTE